MSISEVKRAFQERKAVCDIVGFAIVEEEGSCSGDSGVVLGRDGVFEDMEE